MSGTPRVVIFARRPELGKVKSRLAVDIGDEAALRFYETVLARLLERLSACAAWSTSIAITPDEAVGEPFFERTGCQAVPQRSGDLGTRMSRFLATASRAEPVVIVGSDVPALSVQHVAAALHALKTHDLALGPSPDGGYWLIGASVATSPGLFTGVRWSSRHALEDTLANAGALSIARLESLQDVDDGASYARYLLNEA